MSVPGWGSDVSFARDYHTLITSVGEGEDRAYLNDSSGNDIIRAPGFQAKSASRSPIAGTAPAIVSVRFIRGSVAGGQKAGVIWSGLGDLPVAGGCGWLCYGIRPGGG